MASLVLLDDERVDRMKSGEQQERLYDDLAATTSAGGFRSQVWLKAPNVLLLDLTGSADGGASLIDEISEGGVTAIVLLPAGGAFSGRVATAQSGRNDFPAEPAVLVELTTVVDVLAGRREGSHDAGSSRSCWVLDMSDWVLIPPAMDAPRIRLSAQDFIVLRTLISSAGRPVTRKEIVGALGKDYLDYDQRRLDTQMRRLRRKVSEACGLKLPVKTIHSVGYTFVADVEVRR